MDATENEEIEETETWMDMVIRRRSMAEEKQALATRLSLLDDWNKLKHRVNNYLLRIPFLTGAFYAIGL